MNVNVRESRRFTITDFAKLSYGVCKVGVENVDKCLLTLHNDICVDFVHGNGNGTTILCSDVVRGFQPRKILTNPVSKKNHDNCFRTLKIFVSLEFMKRETTITLLVYFETS